MALTQMDEREVARQTALDALDILDRPRDERIDRVTRLAQQLFNVPMVSDCRRRGFARRGGFDEGSRFRQQPVRDR